MAATVKRYKHMQWLLLCVIVGHVHDMESAAKCSRNITVHHVHSALTHPDGASEAPPQALGLC